MTITNLVRYAALFAAMFISYSTQRDLALSHGIPDAAAYAVPIAIDLCMVWAVRVGRDIALTVAVAVLANVAGVLSAEDLRAVNTWVAAGLHAVFPFLVYRMHRTAPDATPDTSAEAAQVAITAPQAAPLDQDMTGHAIAPQAAAQSRADSWPDDDLWADFEATEPADSAATPPSPEDVKAVIAELGGHATGQQLARHYGVSDRTGRRYLRLAAEVDA
ncbi:DUF2637 domain-containing protein [Streptomyces althioticus]|uniref:DUF2637 domain-containing protein n=1 Tax=Streptomyces althioticus TaxID=83380 RepID=UPI0038736A5E|nr:DUF2637 domain-containing protein [Streptomyces althioticus]